MPRGYPNQPKAQAAPTHPSDPSDPSDCYDCRTIDQRLAELADKLSRVDGRMLARLDDLVLQQAVSETMHVALVKRVAALEQRLAEHAGMATVPVANGHGPDRPHHPSTPTYSLAALGLDEPEDKDEIPPLRVPKTRPASAAPTERRKPGPKPGTPRKRKVDALEEW